jgi:hypothetical protein
MLFTLNKLLSMKLQCKILITLCLVLSFYKLDAQIITTIAGGGTTLGDGGLAILAQTSLPGFGAFDFAGNYYFPHNAGAPRIRKIDASGLIFTVVGDGTAGFSGDGGAATSAKIRPSGFDVDSVGNIFLSDGGNNRLRKVDAITGIITTIAGNGSPTSTGNGGLASLATIKPIDVCLDNRGNIFISDEAGQSIRKINSDGIISHVADINGLGLSFTKQGKLCAGVVTRIVLIDTATGAIDTIAGTGIAAFNGDGLPALSTNLRCRDLAIDDTGNIYIADDVNDRVRKIDTFGIVHTVAGTGVASFSGDGGLASAATLYDLEGVAIDACGNLYIADKSNHRIRKVTFNPPTTPSITLSGITTATVGATVTVNATVSGAGSSYTIRWFKNSALFSTTTLPTTTFVKGAGTDTITARTVPTIVYCYDSTIAEPHVVMEASVGVGYVSERQQYSVYPNPAQQELAIRSPAPINTVTISSPVGQQWLAYTGSGSTEVQLSIAHLPAGLYIVRVNNGYSTKMIKE